MDNDVNILIVYILTPNPSVFYLGCNVYAGQPSIENERLIYSYIPQMEQHEPDDLAKLLVSNTSYVTLTPQEELTLKQDMSHSR